MSGFTEANRKAYNDLSADYNTKPWQHKIASQVSDALRDRKDWIGVNWVKPDEPTYGREVKLLDYACGTGSITKALGPLVTNIRGIDISENMVEAYNNTARSSGLKREQVNAVVGDLFAESIPDHLATPEFSEFDIAVIGLGFHHFEDPQLATNRLAERLKAGTGVLVIVDFLPFDGEHQNMGQMQHTIKHSGFSRAAMQTFYSKAGLENFEFDVLDEPAVMELKDGTRERGIFIAKGKKQPTAWGKFVNWVSGVQDSAMQQVTVIPREAPTQFNLTGGHARDPGVPAKFNYTGGKDSNFAGR